MIKDRIKELRKVAASSLIPNPKNWRTHPIAQQEALTGILEEVGFAGGLLAREIEGGQLMLIDGHLRADLLGDEVVSVLVLDVTEEEADKVLLTFDPLGLLADTDTRKLDELLRGVNTGSEALQEMLSALAEKEGLYLTQPGELLEGEPEETPPKVLACPRCGTEVNH